MSLNELKAFNAVARVGGFVKASQDLNRSQPTITTQIKNLERKYGIELFFRKPGKAAEMTPFGQKLFETTRQLFSLEDDAKNILMSAKGSRGGFLRLGAISPRWATSLMAFLIKKYSGLDLKLDIFNSKKLIDAILNSEIDIAFLGSHQEESLCYMKRISKPEIVMMVNKKNPLASKEKISAIDFRNSTLLHRELGSETRSLLDQKLNSFSLRPKRVVYLGSREGAISAVEQNLGISPVSIEEFNRSSEIKTMTFEDFQITGEVYIVCLRSRMHLPIIRETLDFLEKSSPLD